MFLSLGDIWLLIAAHPQLPLPAGSAAIPGDLGVDAQGARQDLGRRVCVHAVISPGRPCRSGLGAGFGSGVRMRVLFVSPHLAEAAAWPLPASTSNPPCRSSQKSPLAAQTLLEVPGGFRAASPSECWSSRGYSLRQKQQQKFSQIFSRRRQGPGWLHPPWVVTELSLQRCPLP